MELSREEVRKIADLAKLELSEDEIDLYAGQLSSILGFFQTLQELDTSQIPPTASVLPLKNVFRADTPLPALAPEQVVANAPRSLGNQFLVDSVLDDE
ncbi:MAG: Asp-tRNA(Asn)/Glu-tRNA(Gln) amidotransferase subunit GatC [Anaerolineae bacterium]|nr:Asp-tRNA(Asn)/Glu-tRNA(Gln) amidotransferase subunit GatC [Anaerolineae bacterium]